MKRLNFIYGYFVIGALLCSCNMPAESKSKRPTIDATPVVTATPKAEIVTPTSDLAELCKQLAHIKILPDPGSSDHDEIYDAIIAKGKRIMPCLVEEITNDTPMHDPRSAPVWQHYKVGDTAVFLLVDIAKDDELLEKMLPQPYREEWKTNGVYAYFNYVSTMQNRQELQKWWRMWLAKQKGTND